MRAPSPPHTRTAFVVLRMPGRDGGVRIGASGGREGGACLPCGCHEGADRRKGCQVLIFITERFPQSTCPQRSPSKTLSLLYRADNKVSFRPVPETRGIISADAAIRGDAGFARHRFSDPYPGAPGEPANAHNLCWSPPRPQASSLHPSIVTPASLARPMSPTWEDHEGLHPEELTLMILFVAFLISQTGRGSERTKDQAPEDTPGSLNLRNTCVPGKRSDCTSAPQPCRCGTGSAEGQDAATQE